MKGRIKLFGKISVIDIGLIILLGAVVFFAMRFAAPQNAAVKPGDKKITYVVEVYKKDEGFADKIITGSKLHDSLKGYEIGVITGFSREGYREETDDEAAGIIRFPVIDDLYYYYITVEAQAQVTEKTTMVGQYEVLVGKEVFVKSRGFASTGFIVALAGVRD